MKGIQYLGEALSLMNAAQVYLASRFLITDFIAIFFIESFVSSLIIFVLCSPFVVKKTTFKEVSNNQLEYFFSGLIAFLTCYVWYKCAGMISIGFGLAAKGLCYPLSVMLIFAISSSITGSIMSNLSMVVVIFINIFHSVDTSLDGFFDIYSGIFYLALYVIFAVSSDFIARCMINRNGIPKFLVANSFYIILYSSLLLLDPDIDNSSGVQIFMKKNPYTCIALTLLSTVSKILGPYYIYKQGTVAYSNTRVSTYAYFNIIKCLAGKDRLWGLGEAIFHLMIYTMVMFIE
ncbi:hypothetical protein CWI42_030570 [Ordospora colligata]|uniref:Uncharacterized protein n=1 Tax=Ordospora colligata OC4 TaxID=1354746 RepID=A0A0B2UKZ9_9MICR|nr:uncharacterized protein M896_030280 [Ordospora colligata OC4]KHN70043.1 hypothetical protein M896_030280 [Ordospora colligata OC4]TBU16425.1 hypothetical protein CWI41_030240 [Ordospora colligata]TBU16610.1 hypothetical protein CWI40_030640 [Ordospora colligata]TBU19183.1 hypothetical protein CWI42_030570 [Ordospora colligata]